MDGQFARNLMRSSWRSFTIPTPALLDASYLSHEVVSCRRYVLGFNLNTNAQKSWRIAVDIGGTFTDLELLNVETGARRTHKTQTTPDDPSVGLIRGFVEICAAAQVSADEIECLMHGTTIATNAILEERFPKAALITTEGFRDVLEIGRHVRTEIYSQVAEPRPNPIARRFRLELRERVTASGQIETPLDLARLDAIIDFIHAEEISVVAVCLLHACANDEHERRVRDRLRERLPETYVSISSEISPEIREYERTATTVLNALLMPTVRDYLARLLKSFKQRGWTVPTYLMQSNGGVTTPQIAAEQPVRLVLSGPSGGVRAAEVLSVRLKLADLVAMDMGGTSFDVSVIQAGRGEQRTSGQVGSMPVRVPMLEIHTVAAGGGSLAAVDGSGRLTVGPGSAGAVPGPVAYGLGGRVPTVTDANLRLGRLDPLRFLGGQMTLDTDAVARAIDEHVATPLASDAFRAADGIVRIAVSHMAAAIKLALYQKGLDPREFSIVSFGGAGGLHAAFVAKEIGAPSVVFPTHCATLSAWGMLYADVSHDLSQSMVCVANRSALARICENAEALIAQGDELLTRSEVTATARRFELSADMRYPGQGWEISVDLPDGPRDEEMLAELCRRFHTLHNDRYAHNDERVEPEIVTLRARAIGQSRRPAEIPVATDTAGKSAVLRRVYLDGEFESIAVFERAALAPQTNLEGPCVVEEEHATLLIPGGWSAEVLADGSIVARPVADGQVA